MSTPYLHGFLQKIFYTVHPIFYSFPQLKTNLFVFIFQTNLLERDDPKDLVLSEELLP